MQMTVDDKTLLLNFALGLNTILNYDNDNRTNTTLHTQELF